ncbi:MAG TPA: histidine--tRNA ligase, partial [Gammaproteobacteria bacterium]|nr:histidine--tRNA ligase [Gammaproteobacteria bacterium]
ERLIALLEESDRLPQTTRADVYLVLAGEAAQAAGLALAERLRDELPGLRLLTHCGGGGFKAQFKRADRSGARLALVLGEEELASGEVGIKHLREERPQERVPLDAVAARLRELT